MEHETALPEQLKQIPLFAGFSDRQVADLLAIAKERHYPEGEVIIRQGESGLGFFLILKGATVVQTGDTPLARLGPGEYFGEAALLLEGVTRTADVLALEDTDCLVITQWAFKSLLAAHPEMGLAIMSELARRLNQTPGRLSE